MPVPKPRKGENQDAFHSRCMGDEVMVKDYPEQKQRNAVCYSAWERKDKKPSGNYDPHQPRDRRGRWTAGGGAGGYNGPVPEDASINEGEAVNDVPMYHYTTKESADMIKENGFNYSSNSMYGEGVYFTDGTAYAGMDKGAAKLEVKLKPHTQLQIDKDFNAESIYKEVGGKSQFESGFRQSMLDAGIGSARIRMDDETYTVVFDKTLITSIDISAQPKGNESFATFAANMDTSKVTTKKYKGKEYLVAPTVMIRTPIVMNGLRYTAEEVQKFPAAWDGRPVTLFHPKDEEGDYVSANHSAVPEDVHLGMLRNTRFENGVLRSEAWVEKEHTKATRPEVLEYYEGKKQGLQVSTGLFHDFLAVPGKMEDGTHYNGDVINIRPDHLALLPGGQGACSWEDGCGLRANEDCIEGFTRFFVAGMSDIELRQALSAAVSKMVTGDYYNFIEAIYQDDKQLVYEENTKSGTKLKRCSYSIDKNGVATLGADAEEVYRKVIYEPVSKGGLQVSDTNTSFGPAAGEQIADNNRIDDFMKGVSKMAIDDKKRKAKVDGLIACERCKFEEKDREWLMSLNEEQLELVSPPDNVIVKPAEEPKPKEEPKANKEEPKAGDPVVQKSPMTAEEWLVANQDVPQEIRDTLADSLLTNRAVRDGLVKQITEDKRNQYTANELQAKPTSELKKIAAFLAQEEQPAQDQQQAAFYGAKGFGAVPQANQDDGNKGPEPLRVNTLAEELAKRNRK